VLQDGPTEEILFQIEDRGLKDHVKILNGVSHAKIVQFMKQNNVLLLPSLEEGIANVVLEAMAMGLPVITTDCGGMREIVIESETGWMVPIRNPSAMANALEKFTQLSSIEVGSVRRKAHELVKEKCSTQHNLETFCNWYRQIVEED
jgi:colanic acid/amylovoran biosynthesis glycosyltransferase